MFRSIFKLSQGILVKGPLVQSQRQIIVGARHGCPNLALTAIQPHYNAISRYLLSKVTSLPGLPVQSLREFHAPDSKVHYLDFRHRFRTNHLRLHLLIIRRQKMKKHRRRKFRRKFKFLLAKLRLKREIAKEKLFRVELLSMIRKAENFDPKEYALKKIHEINNKPRELTKEERLEEIKELIRINRYQVDYIKPKHRRADI